MVDFSTFAKVSKDQWLEKIKLDLKGKAIDTLNWDINDRLIISPFKDSSDLPNGSEARSIKKDNAWAAMEPIWVSDDLSAANGQLLLALQGGSNGIRIHTSEILNVQSLNKLFNEVYLEMITVDWVLPMSLSISDQMAHLSEYLDSQGKSSREIKLSFDGNLKSLQSTDIGRYPTVKFITIDGLVYYNGIEEIERELGSIIYELCQSIEQVGASDLAGLFNSIQIKLAIDDCYLLNIAAARAIKHLVRLLFEGYGYTPEQDVHLSCITPKSILTDDINYNRIKQSTAALSAVASSADTIQIYHSEGEDGESSKFSRKIARNTFHLLSMESYMDRVVDPAAGSYYIESLTDIIGEKAWTYFQQMCTKYNQA